MAMWQALGSGEVRMIDRREDEECVRVGEDTARGAKRAFCFMQ